MIQVLYLRVFCTSLKAFFQNMRKKSPKILLKTIRGRSDHNLIKIREKRTKQIFIGNLKFEMHGKYSILSCLLRKAPNL